MSSSCFKNVWNGYRLSLRFGSFFGAMMVSVAQAAGPGGGPDWFDPNTGRGFRKNIPDFYQHQYLCDNARQNWEVGKNETGGGWCRPTALANCLFSFKVTGYNGLLHNSPDINDPNKWLENACKAIEDLEKVTIAGYQKYLDDRGHGEKACPGPGGGLKFTQYVISPTTGKIYYKSSDGSWKEKAGPAFDLYKKELLDGQDVLIRFAPGTNNAGASGRWWGNFHYVTGAGVDCGNAPGGQTEDLFCRPR